ncbi:accessory Sec system protein translocase subunit SecY2 [Staphylococcus muscae]|uniref:Accessory Sec system protein translocase subunit SecY2 n=1 Tax=Staphylococcus muscae TaxID=1294 RepID=A0A240BS12_9STAP|nr:accessory Sec system protein translocase subunit SecY2 [Staphylococcus muscae]AVQ34041.1 accessory Sec system protein translocase subunit SecY2 [Staphylococcus muscae]PNZ05699.1 accessory Sec system protein translocase subunit SecY2 [Staphylococcus muscae]GGA82227.1 accessory Sec system protein translocase subunit SecY2 [Staphylococcus muscae]SNV98504.1 accessory Sec system translocase SecY2 [Staphylococcus muscae]
MKNNLLHRILRQYEYKIVYKRLAFTLVILFIYILGSRIPILSQSKLENGKQSFYELAVTNVGGDIQNLNIFSLGLGPWLTAMVVLMLLRYKNVEKMMQMTRKEKHYQEKLLALAFSIVQGLFVISRHVEMKQADWTTIVVLLLIIVTGTMLLIWLADQNIHYGIAGAMPIVLLSIVRSTLRHHGNPASMDHIVMGTILVLIMLVMLILLCIELVEYRLPYRDIMQVTQNNTQTFVAWKLNPAGSISIMISLSVFILLSSLVNVIAYLVIGREQPLHIIELGHPIGVTIYIVLQVVLSYALSRLLINTKQKSKEFLKSGNYFEGVAPGIETEHYLNHKARIICWTGALMIGVIIGGPLYLSLLVPQFSQQIYFVIQMMIMMYISINIAETIRTYFYFDKYKPFLTKYW